MDRHEADEQLRKAIIDHAIAYDSADTNDLLDQVLVITSWMVPDTDDDPRTAYATQMLGGHIQHHTALGLCYVALDVLREQVTDD